jgi:hypothetical protein
LGMVFLLCIHCAISMHEVHLPSPSWYSCRPKSLEIPVPNRETVRRQCPVSSQCSHDKQTQTKSKTQVDQWITSFQKPQNKNLLTTNLTYLTKSDTQRIVPPVSVPRPSELTSRRLFRENVGRHSRLFASRSERLVAEANQVTRSPSAKPFLLLSWDFLR